MNLQKVKAISNIYKGLLEDKSTQQIHKELIGLTLDKNTLSYFAIVCNRANKKASTIKRNYENNIFIDSNNVRKAKEQYLKDHNLKQTTLIDVMAVALSDMIFKGAWNYNADKLINKGLREFETQEKAKIIEKELNSKEFGNSEEDLTEGENEPRAEQEPIYDNSKVFWVCSQHKDSASDHKNYQGKIYYNENYDKRDERITEYIRKHNLKSVQWVMGEPVWLITRPHCRHYFTHYTYNQIATGAYHVPTRKIGMRKLQTKSFKDVPSSLKAQEAVKYYSDRLKLIKSLRKIKDNYILKAQYQKCIDLIKKWKQQI